MFIKKMCFTVCFLLASVVFAMAQQSESVREKYNLPAEWYEIPEKETVPVGGMQEFYQFLYKNIVYPKSASSLGIQGIAYIRFVIDEQGNVIHAEVLEGKEVGYGIDEEAMRVIKLTKWVPAMDKGKNVKQRKIIPIKFTLSSAQPKDN